MLDLLCDPSWLYISLWFGLNVSLTLLNKGVMVFGEFKFPITISLIHMVLSSVLSFIAKTCFGYNPGNNRPVEIEEIPEHGREVRRKVLMLSFLFALNIIFGNSSLHECSVAFVQVVRAIIPMMTMVMSVLFLKAQYTRMHYLACALVTVGVGLSCFGEINLTLRGLFITVTGCFLSSAKSIAIKMSLSDIHSFDLLRMMSPVAAVEMLGLVFLSGEFTAIMNANVSIGSLLVALLTGVFAFMLNLTNFLATFYTSPLTVTIVGCVKQVVTIILSVVIFDKQLTLLNTLGVIITTVGSLWYGLLKGNRPPPPPEPEPAKQGDEEEDIQ